VHIEGFKAICKHTVQAPCKQDGSDVQVKRLPDAIKVTAEAETYCSPLYRPPELYNTPHECQLDGRIDVWALGCVLYFMMMGINPFEKLCQGGASLVLAIHRCLLLLCNCHNCKPTCSITLNCPFVELSSVLPKLFNRFLYGWREPSFQRKNLCPY
jgi:serine/threonine protein kinase